jgi:Tfp pilus assembly protein PilX
MMPSRFHSPSRFALLRTDAGFTMIVVLLVMLVTSLLLVAAFTAANGEVRLTSLDRAQKKAYYAAEAGVEDYEYHLTQDGNYLSYCTSPPSENPALNQVGETSHKATVPSTTGEPTNEQYAIQLLPAESDKIEKDHKCDPNHLVETMIEEEGSATGTFRIESTGYSGGEERTLVATFRNANFVSYVWYTKYETGDPVVYGEPPTTPTALPNYYNECGNFYGIRPAQGRLTLSGFEYPLRCADNLFLNGESVNGPMHTADHAGICGSPVFGRNENDRIEFGNGGKPEGEGYSSEGHCSEPTPNFKGKHILPKEVLSIEPPPGDEELEHIVEPAYLYEEKTEIILEGSTMTVIKHKGAGAGIEKEEKAVAYPTNGVIYVAGSCGQKYSPFGPVPRYAGNEVGAETDTTCGNVYVHGEYTKSLTIAAENDVVINGNITTPVNGEGTPTTNALLGLIANNFVRIYHPVVETYEGKGPELGTVRSELEGASHKETIKVEPQGALATELKVEVKESGTEFEVLVLNAKSEVLEKTGHLKEAKQLLTLTSPYVVYAEGAKYAEGSAEKLKALGAVSLGHAEIIKVEPKSPKLGKELQVEVKESATAPEFTVAVLNEKGVEIEKTAKSYKEAKELAGVSLTNVTFSKGAKFSEGEKERLKKSAPQWLDEKCNQYHIEAENTTVTEKFNSGVRMCEYTDKGVFACDAPNSSKDMKEPTIYAAMLAVKHGVIVDNFSCGESSLGSLKVYGAVAGLYTNGYSGASYEGKLHGYPYNANYDNRLQAEEPPHFLNPIQAAWYVQRQSVAPNP